MCQLHPDYAEDRANEAESPERDLWLAVIQRALVDLRIEHGPYRRRRKDAWEWITMPSRDFLLVCRLAGLEAETVREVAHRYKKLVDSGQAASRIHYHRQR